MRSKENKAHILQQHDMQRKIRARYTQRKFPFTQSCYRVNSETNNKTDTLKIGICKIAFFCPNPVPVLDDPYFILFKSTGFFNDLYTFTDTCRIDMGNLDSLTARALFYVQVSETHSSLKEALHKCPL
jgi:hypothetical protein